MFLKIGTWLQLLQSLESFQRGYNAFFAHFPCFVATNLLHVLGTTPQLAHSFFFLFFIPDRSLSLTGCHAWTLRVWSSRGITSRILSRAI